MSNQIVAKTILAQLGGNHFIVMTGAEHFISQHNSLTFSIKGCPKINKVVIELMPSDTYTLTFYKMTSIKAFINGKEPKVVKICDMVYCDNLQQVFTSETGLYTSL